jgi:uncharacterized protein
MRRSLFEEKGVSDKSILWRRLDKPGHEAARLSFKDPCWQLAGTAVFAHAQQPCRLDYRVACSSAWQTLSGKITGWVGNNLIEVEVAADSENHWRLNGREWAEVSGCIDVDLNFSPSTNLLPIRRLSLAIGEEAKVCAAWLRFPSFTLEPLEQIYRRIDAATYHYESAGGKFVAKLQVNEAGFVTEYPNLWRIEEAVE